MNNAKTSFGLYEATRIIVPGFYFSTLLFVFLWTLIPPGDSAPPPRWTLAVIFLFSTLISGLTMYAKETPKRRRAFQENQPSTYLMNKTRTMSKVRQLDESEAQRLYFFILNTSVPAVFHEKIFFFGTIYHIMILIRRTTFWFGLAAALALGINLALGFTLSQLQSLVVFGLIVWLIYLLNVRYNKADRKMQENYRDQIFWLEMNNDLVEQLLRKRRAA